MDLSGEIARHEMADWDDEFQELCETNRIKIELDKRYVDDKNIVLGMIPYGYRWFSGKVVFNEEWITEDSKKPLDEHTCKVLVDLANSIRPWIQMVGDYSSKYPDKMVPMLDLKIKMITLTEPEDIENGIPEYKYQAVYFIFFKKSMARSSIMHAKTAMPEKTKRENACNELMRRTLNTLQGMPDSEKDTLKAKNDFMELMKKSGYGERFRKDTVLAAHKGILKKD